MYMLQFKMQKTIFYFDNFEKYDCNIFDSSLELMGENKNKKKGKDRSVFTIPDFTNVRYQREAFDTWKNFYEP